MKDPVAEGLTESQVQGFREGVGWKYGVESGGIVNK